MIIVMATVKVRPGCMDEAWQVSKAHVARSRLEPGCVSHAVYRDDEHEHHLVFVEEWASEEALKAHFAVPASREFVNALVPLGVGRQALRIYSAQELPFPQSGAA